MNPEKQRSILELIGLATTSVGMLCFEILWNQKLLFLIPAITLWCSYIGYRILLASDLLRKWGFRTDNLKYAAKVNGTVLVLGMVVLLTYRISFGWQMLPREALLIAILYPVWGLLQQFALQCLVVRNLRTLDVPVYLTVITGALGFGIVHLPDFVLALLTAGAGLIWIPVYLHVPNLYALAISHSWLGTLAYYWVLERQPIQELLR